MMEMTNTLNNGMCRCCSSEGTFKDIKTKYHWMGEEEVYADMLTDCFDIKISTPEDMDNGICEVCITQLRNAANFKKQVLHTEAQFKRRLQNKEIKNPIKLESMDEDPIESDHLSDPDFSSNEYEVPIKEELEDKPKAKKRAAKATTSRAKKPKAESEPAKKRVLTTSVVKVEWAADEGNGSSSRVAKEVKPKRKSKAKLKGDAKPRSPAEIHLHRNNIRVILECTNATPIRGCSDVGYQCCFCKNEYPNPADLKTHTLEQHDSELKIKRDFAWEKNMATFSIKLDITKLRCELCGSDIDKLDLLMTHLIEQHGKKLHTDIRSHVIPFKFTDDTLRCIFCSEVYTTFKALMIHMMVHFRHYICEQCDSGFLNRKLLRDHEKTHETGTFTCTSCPKVFDTLRKLKSHERQVHSTKKLNRCGYCFEKFRDYIQKVKHLKEAHDVQMKSSKCKACDKVFDSKSALRTHVRRDHLIERRYKCTQCDMCFYAKSQLTIHMVKHTGAKEFTCELCWKSYGLQSTLNEHMNIHANIRRWKCEHCDVAYVSRSNLRKHIRSKHS